MVVVSDVVVWHGIMVERKMAEVRSRRMMSRVERACIRITVNFKLFDASSDDGQTDASMLTRSASNYIVGCRLTRASISIVVSIFPVPPPRGGQVAVKRMTRQEGLNFVPKNRHTNKQKLHHTVNGKPAPCTFSFNLLLRHISGA